MSKSVFKRLNPLGGNLSMFSPFRRKNPKAKFSVPGNDARVKERVWPRGTWQLARYPNLLETTPVHWRAERVSYGDLVTWEYLRDCGDYEEGPSMGGSRHLFEFRDDWLPSEAALRHVLASANNDIVEYIVAELRRMKHLLP